MPLLGVQHTGALWIFREQAAPGPKDPVECDAAHRSWLVVTPLVSGRDLVGVMYNDTALTRAPVDEEQQARAAVFCGVLAGLFRTARGRVGFRPQVPEPERRGVARRVIRELTLDASLTGEQIAGRLGISPGHLARSFKLETGASLVDYRNRLRIERFLAHVGRTEQNLLEAALDAGFGSYAQFHRVYRKLVGSTPREHGLGRKARSSG